MQSECRSCNRSTRHDLLFEISHSASAEEYNENHSWQVVQCRGCETIGFRYRLDDYDIVEEDWNGDPIHSITIKNYPPAIVGHQPLSDTWIVPDLIRNIYRQSLAAYATNANLLAGIGFRATIEAVCNHLKVSGSNLEKRIDQLAKLGHISNGDKKRLHAIRFLGNDAAHEIKEPNRSEISVALDITEHLIKSVFILEHKARGLDVPVETFSEFLDLLQTCCAESTGEHPQSIAAILGRHRRRVGPAIQQHEEQLIAHLESSSLNYIKKSSVETVDGKPVQLYKVDALKAMDLPF